MEKNNLDLWENWIYNNGLFIKGDEEYGTRYDLLCEMVISSYALNEKRRHMDLKDRVTYFLKWWQENKNKMLKYKTTTSIGKLLDCDHTTVLHHIHKRKISRDYNKNTSCIKDYLES